MEDLQHNIIVRVIMVIIPTIIYGNRMVMETVLRMRSLATVGNSQNTGLIHVELVVVAIPHPPCFSSWKMGRG